MIILFYLSNLTKSNHKLNNKYNYNTTIIFFNPDATSFPVVLLLLKRITKGDNKGNTKEIQRKYKRNKGKGTSPQNSGRERRIFLFVLSPLNFTTVDTAKQVY